MAPEDNPADDTEPLRAEWELYEESVMEKRGIVQGEGEAPKPADGKKEASAPKPKSAGDDLVSKAADQVADRKKDEKEK